MAYIAFDDLKHIREKHANQTLVFCSGSFDIIHGGHALFFEDCKRHGDILVAMLASDKVLAQNKGKGRPIINQHVRMKLVDSLKPVDYTLLDETLTKDGAHPLDCLRDIFAALKPNIYVINEDASDIPYREKTTKELGITMVVLKRTAPTEFEGISTSQIIEKLKRAG